MPISPKFTNFNPLFFTITCASLVSCLIGCSGVPTAEKFTHTDKHAQLTQVFNQLSQHNLTKEQDLTQFNNNNPPKILDCGSLQTGKPITLTGQNQLPNNCDLWQKNAQFIIEQNDVSLDCQGVAMSATDDKRTAITIRTPNDNQTGVQNIRIKNCLLSGYNHGILIEQKTPANVRYQQLLAQQTTLDKQRQQSPNHILLDHILVDSSRNSGIFIGDHVQAVTLANSRVQHSGTVGVYLEFGSGNNQILYSQFSGNGFRQTNVAGVAIGKPNREAIAIDSSAHNVIAYNRFDGNGAGGVFLYRNCFEHADDPSQANHFLRTQGSNDNQILSNIFTHEPVGVWVASRQSRNLKGFGCGAYLIKEDLISSYHLDDSEQNLIQNNRFADNKNAIILEDDRNIVRQNQFADSVILPIKVGSQIRLTSSEGAVKGNHLHQNQFAHRKPINEMIQWVGDSDKGNLNLACGNQSQLEKDEICWVK